MLNTISGIIVIAIASLLIGGYNFWQRMDNVTQALASNYAKLKSDVDDNKNKIQQDRHKYDINHKKFTADIHNISLSIVEVKTNQNHIISKLESICKKFNYYQIASDKKSY
jgi:hypothetical protein